MNLQFEQSLVGESSYLFHVASAGTAQLGTGRSTFKMAHLNGWQVKVGCQLELSQAGDQGSHFLSLWDSRQGAQISSWPQIYVLRASVPRDRNEKIAHFLRPGPRNWHRLPPYSIGEAITEPRFKRRHRPCLSMEVMSKNQVGGHTCFKTAIWNN